LITSGSATKHILIPYGSVFGGYIDVTPALISQFN